VSRNAGKTRGNDKGHGSSGHGGKTRDEDIIGERGIGVGRVTISKQAFPNAVPMTREQAMAEGIDARSLHAFKGSKQHQETAAKVAAAPDADD